MCCAASGCLYHYSQANVDYPRVRNNMPFRAEYTSERVVCQRTESALSAGSRRHGTRRVTLVVYLAGRANSCVCLCLSAQLGTGTPTITPPKRPAHLSHDHCRYTFMVIGDAADRSSRHIHTGERVPWCYRMCSATTFGHGHVRFGRFWADRMTADIRTFGSCSHQHCQRYKMIVLYPA